MRRHPVQQMVISNPFELFISLVSTPVGASVLLGEVSPTSITASLPPVIQTLWGLTLTGGGVLALTGLIARALQHRWYLSGLFFERIGMTLLAASSASYGLVILFYADISQSLVAATLQIALALASMARAYGIGIVIRKLRGSLSAD